MSKKPNKCSLVDITVPHAAHEQARRFYAKTFGWSVNIDLPGYPVFGTGDGGAEVGIMWEGNPESPTDFTSIWQVNKPVPFLDTDDIDATAAEVEANGGKVIAPPRTVGPIRVGAFQDPWGNDWFLIQQAV
ncbi:VOC family protein [Nocardia sp. 2]|uniref:VOC family protein n=1 Tax=Nocardia acididurans TaxID=2802282 RepID=A0ABS1MHV7_9NOCA|nr:VOC family protein [Nocardia acididurans]MBL1079620.1 VOC family protein [Nocardia acididurans]